jgi:type IV fimbrial biogenesis protein FimT
MKPRAGHTLTELLIVLALAALLAARAAPSMHAALQRQRLAAGAQAFHAALDLARSEAVARASRIDLVATDGTGWAGGWTVFADANGNRIADPGEEVMLRQPPLPPGLHVAAALTDAQRPPYIAYNGVGRTRTHASGSAPQFGSLTFELDGQVRRIKINFLGRARICDPQQDRAC